MNLIGLAFKLLKRDGHSWQLRMLVVALLVAVTTHSTIGFHTERIENAMVMQASSLMGGDLVVRSPTRDPELDTLLDRNTSALAVEFSSVVLAGESLQLSAIKAVSEHYPLKAELKIADQPYSNDSPVTHGPAAGSVWLEARLLSALEVNVGDTVEVGDAVLRVDKVLTFEPDRGGNFYSFVPRLMMSTGDLDKANLIQTGSRVEFYYQFLVPDGNLTPLQKQVEALLKPGQTILTLQSRQRSISAALSRAQSYLKLASLMAILLASVALAMGARFFSEMRFDTAALLRCFGLSSKQILVIFSVQLVTLALISGIIGGALGWSMHFVLIDMLSDLLPENVPLPSLQPFYSGCILAVVILLGFSFPALLQLQRTPPLRVLRKDLIAAPLSTLFSYIVVIVLITVLMLWYTRDTVLIAALSGGIVAAWFVTLILTNVFTRLLESVGKRSSLPVRAGLRNLRRRQMSTRVQLLGFGLTGMAMLVVLLVRGELINTWQDQLPDQAPNHFVLNVLPEEGAPFQQFLLDNDINSQPLYPVVRGRLTHINEVPVNERISKEDNNTDADGTPREINRELNLTWAEQLPSDNRIEHGQWWSDATQDKTGVSIEAELAEKLGLKLGDELTFFVANQTFIAHVTSIRSVKWESFQPNFYMIFNPGGLEDLPFTYLTSFYLPSESKPLLKKMVQRFPAITLLEVDVILKQIRTILDQVSAAVEFILLFVLAAGLTITLATLVTTMPQRYREGALMRTLGTTSKQLIMQQWSEFFAIGFLSGLVACFGAELVRLAIYIKLFALPYTPSLWIWIIVPPTLGLLIGGAGQISSRRILRMSPVTALRE
ncbi:ABC transporter permease [Ketobacter sp.]